MPTAKCPRCGTDIAGLETDPDDEYSPDVYPIRLATKLATGGESIVAIACATCSHIIGTGASRQP